MQEKTRLNLAILSTYPPTECGIATYTKAIAQVCEDYYLKNKIRIIALDSDNNKYSRNVICQIKKDDAKSYVEAAKKINKSDIEVVSLQHEYGMFGGKDGKYILNFLENIKKPVVTTMHSVLESHSEHRLELTKRIIDLSQALLVMTNASKRILTNYFDVKHKKIYVVPHGGPNIRPQAKNITKQQFGFKNKTVLSTFGLINPGKGIEYAIKAINALPKIYKEQIVYLVLGVTHPQVKLRDKEAYRDSLVALVKKYKLENTIKFVNKYLTYPELVNYLKASDIYLAPQLDLLQAVSGTLAYAICCDNAIISTPTPYAQEILANGRGIIVEAKNYTEIADAIKSLVNNNDKMEKIKFAAYRYARNMIFPRVSLEYLRVFEIESQRKKEERYEKLFDKFYFAPTLRHVKNMTTALGMIQHAQLDIPDLSFGYSIDDQSRALIVVNKYAKVFGASRDNQKLITIYLNFIKKAQLKNKYFHNFMNEEGKFIDQEGSSDSFGRTMWALGYLSAHGSNKQISQTAKNIFYKNIGLIPTLKYIRSKAYTILGLARLKEKEMVDKLACDIVKSYDKNHNNDWNWFEDRLLFANAILPYSLLFAYNLTSNKKYLKIAKETFDFLNITCRIKNSPSPIGQDGWYIKGKKKAIFDQQAIDAADMVLCASELYKITKDELYLEIAKDWFRWFHGNNIHGMCLFDYATGGCYDGLTKTSVNLNEGAESILVYLLAYMKITKIIKSSNQK